MAHGEPHACGTSLATCSRSCAPHACTCMCDRECESRLMQFTPNFRMTPACPAGAFRSPATCYRNLVGVVVVQCVFLFAARFARPRTRSRDQLAWPLLTPHHTHRSCAWHCMAGCHHPNHTAPSGDWPGGAHTFCCWFLYNIYTDPDLNGQAERRPK
jgi:hypothetical protein